MEDRQAQELQQICAELNAVCNERKLTPTETVLSYWLSWFRKPTTIVIHLAFIATLSPLFTGQQEMITAKLTGAGLLLWYIYALMQTPRAPDPIQLAEIYKQVKIVADALSDYINDSDGSNLDELRSVRRQLDTKVARAKSMSNYTVELTSLLQHLNLVLSNSF